MQTVKNAHEIGQPAWVPATVTTVMQNTAADLVAASRVALVPATSHDWADLFEKNYERMVRFFVWRDGCQRADAEDIVTKAFEKVMRRAAVKGIESDNVAGYVWRAAKHCAFDFYSWQEVRSGDVSQDAPSGRDGDDNETYAPLLADMATIGMVDMLVNNETSEKIAKCLAMVATPRRGQSPEAARRNRQILDLRGYGYSLKEIAHIQGDNERVTIKAAQRAAEYFREAWDALTEEEEAAARAAAESSETV